MSNRYRIDAKSTPGGGRARRTRGRGLGGLCLINPSQRKFSTPNMIGRPGCWAMAMNGGSSASYLASTPCVPLFCTLFVRGGNRRAFRLAGEGGDHFHCTVEHSPSHIQCRSSEDCQNSLLWCTSNLVPVWVVLWHPKGGYQNRWFSKWHVLGDFQNSILVHQQFWYPFGCF